MTIALLRSKLRKGHAGRFRALKVGEEIAESDVVVGTDYYTFPAPGDVGQKHDGKDAVVRLEFEK